MFTAFLNIRHPTSYKRMRGGSHLYILGDRGSCRQRKIVLVLFVPPVLPHTPPSITLQKTKKG